MTMCVSGGARVKKESERYKGLRRVRTICYTALSSSNERVRERMRGESGKEERRKRIKSDCEHGTRSLFRSRKYIMNGMNKRERKREREKVRERERVCSKKKRKL